MNNFYVFNIGFNRSGTTSLNSALNILGIPSIHYSFNNSSWFKNNPGEIEEIIRKNDLSGNRILHTLDDKYRGFTDFNGEVYFKDLYKQYPNSKFILTIRPPEDWLKSIIYMERSQNRFQPNTEQEYMVFEKKINRYFTKRKEIRKFFKNKPSQFLEMNIVNGDGWEVLCPFLGLKIPDVPFPYENKTLYK